MKLHDMSNKYTIKCVYLYYFNIPLPILDMANVDVFIFKNSNNELGL